MTLVGFARSILRLVICVCDYTRRRVPRLAGEAAARENQALAWPLRPCSGQFGWEAKSPPHSKPSFWCGIAEGWLQCRARTARALPNRHPSRSGSQRFYQWPESDLCQFGAVEQTRRRYRERHLAMRRAFASCSEINCFDASSHRMSFTQPRLSLIVMRPRSPSSG